VTVEVAGSPNRGTAARRASGVAPSGPDARTLCAAETQRGRCRIGSDLCPECGRCIWHCAHRRAKADRLRRVGGTVRGERARARRGGALRTAAPDELPTRQPPETLADVVAWASWAAWATATGKLDGHTAREVNRSLVTLRAALQVRDLQVRIRELERQLRGIERQRAQHE